MWPIFATTVLGHFEVHLVPYKPYRMVIRYESYDITSFVSRDKPEKGKIIQHPSQGAMKNLIQFGQNSLDQDLKGMGFSTYSFKGWKVNCCLPALKFLVFLGEIGWCFSIF